MAGYMSEQIIRSTRSGPTFLFLVGACLLIYVIYGYRNRGAKGEPEAGVKSHLESGSAKVVNAIDRLARTSEQESPHSNQTSTTGSTTKDVRPLSSKTARSVPAPGTSDTTARTTEGPSATVHAPAQATANPAESNRDSTVPPVRPDERPANTPLPEWTPKQPQQIDHSREPPKPAVKRPRSVDTPRNSVHFKGSDGSPEDENDSDAAGVGWFFEKDPATTVFEGTDEEVDEYISRSRDNDMEHRHPERAPLKDGVYRAHDLSDSNLEVLRRRVDMELCMMMEDVERVILQDHSLDRRSEFLADGVVDKKVIPKKMAEIYWYMKMREKYTQYADICLEEFFLHYRMAKTDDRGLRSDPGQQRSTETHLKQWHRLVASLWFTSRAFSPRGADIHLDSSARVRFKPTSTQIGFDLELVLFLPLDSATNKPDWVKEYANIPDKKSYNERSEKIGGVATPNRAWRLYAQRWLHRHGMDFDDIADRNIVFRPAWAPSKTNFDNQAEGTTTEIPFRAEIVPVDSSEIQKRFDAGSSFRKPFLLIAGFVRPKVVWFSNHRQNAWDLSTVVRTGSEQNCQFDSESLQLLLMMCGPAVSVREADLDHLEDSRYPKRVHGTMVYEIDMGGILPIEKGKQGFVDLNLFPFLQRLYLPFLPDTGSSAWPSSAKLVVYESWGMLSRLMAKKDGLKVVFRSTLAEDAGGFSRDLTAAIDLEKQRQSDPEAWANEIRKVIRSRVGFEYRTGEGTHAKWQWSFLRV